MRKITHNNLFRHTLRGTPYLFLALGSVLLLVVAWGILA